MKTLFILGNGFDINLGLETKYIDFLRFYQSLESDKESIIKLKSNIKDNITNWADFELKLGEYTENIKNPEEFIDIFDHVIDSLGSYLETIENNFDIKSIDADKIFEYLINPEDSLPEADRREIKNFKKNWINHNWGVDVVNFNYTYTFEKILNNNFRNLNIGQHRPGFGVQLNNVYHIHGFVDDGMVIGVNDTSQIKNTLLHSSRKVTNAFIKVNNNRTQGLSIDDIFRTKIMESNLICIFGSSLGDTDNHWWETIGQHLINKESSQLIIFTKREDIKKRLSYKKTDIELEVKELFLKKIRLSEDQQELVANRIYVRTNTSMFSNLIKEQYIRKQILEIMS